MSSEKICAFFMQYIKINYFNSLAYLILLKKYEQASSRRKIFV